MRCVIIMFVIAFFISGCATTGGTPINISQCPPLKSYSKAQRERAAQELRKLANNSELAVFISDYGKLREACRLIDNAVRR